MVAKETGGSRCPTPSESRQANWWRLTATSKSGLTDLPSRMPSAIRMNCCATLKGSPEDAYADATRDGTGQADRPEGLPACAAEGRIVTDGHGTALHRADRDALFVGGQERRRVVEAQEEAEEAHGFERQSEEGSIILSHDRPIKSAARRLTYNGLSPNFKLLRLRCCFWLLRNYGHICSPKLEQNLAAAIRFQGLPERFLELVERVHMLHCGGERSISYEVSQLLVNLLDLCAGSVAYPIDEPESVEAKTTVDELFGRHSWELPTLNAVDDNRAARFERFGQLANGSSAQRIEREAKFLPVESLLNILE